MAGDTLQEFDRLVGAGFSEVQARALVEVVGAPARTDPEVLDTLKLLVRESSEVRRQLDLQGQTIETISVQVGGLMRTAESLSGEYQTIHEDQGVIRGDLRIVGERVKMEGRVARMINVALIAIGATVASLLAVFAR
ncbi:MAG: hypothetical protein OXD50_13525 [Chloroflexi bacterium]|nr:hypothetical protein [Chloroflexota bacterium]